MIENKVSQKTFDRFWSFKTRKVKLVGEYINKKLADDIKNSVGFWQTIKWLRRAGVVNLDEILKEYVSSTNTTLSTIAKLELLSTPVFRRVLWFYNIDFQSFESCVRRLTNEQVDAINNTYQVLIVDEEVPVCLKSGLWNNLRQLIPSKKVTVKSLIHNHEEYDDWLRRYETKTAIAYDYFYLGMGPNLYPNEKSDRVNSKNIASQFFSPKNHKNDFTINREEGGIYWLLDQFTRDNYLWRIDYDIELKNSICPRIYNTGFLLIFMLLLSPLLLTLAMLKFTGHKLLVFANQFMENEVKIDSDFWKTFGMILSFILISYYLVDYLMILYQVLYEISGNHWYLGSIFLFTIMYLFYVSYYKQWIRPYQLPWIGKPLLGYILIQTVYDHWNAINDFLIFLTTSCIDWSIKVVDWLVNNSPHIIVTGFIITTLTLVIARWRLMSRQASNYVNEGNKTSFDFLEKNYLPLVIISYLILFLTLPLLSITTSTNVKNVPDNLLVITFLIGLILMYIGNIIFFRFSPSQVKLIALIGGICQFKKLKYGDLYQKHLTKNSWIKSLNRPVKVIVKVINFTDKWVYPSLISIHFLESFNADAFKVLKYYDNYFKYNYPHNFSTKDRYVMYESLLKGYSVKKALERINNKKTERSKFKKTVLVVSKPVTYGKRFVGDLKKLRQTLKQLCPFISVSKEIE